MKIAWLFPGQGSQAPGMGRDLYESSPAARAVLDLADRSLGYPLTRLMFEGPAAELQLTINAQPAIVASSLASLAALREVWRQHVPEGKGLALPAPAYVAGHSVGEYAALVAAGAASEATGLELVRVRAEAMHAAGQTRPGSMVAVLGLSREAVAEQCRRARERVSGSYVGVANHNAETQVVIAGDADGLEAASMLCQEAGARRCVPLPVSGAFHSEAMAPASGPLREVVVAADLRAAAVPLVANVTAQAIQDAAAIRQELVTQVAQPVLWYDTMRFMAGQDVTHFVELGTGQVLTNLAQRMEGGLKARAAGNSQSIRDLVVWLRGEQ